MLILFTETSLFSLEKRLFWGKGESLNFKGMDYNDNPDVGGLLGHQYRHQLRPNIPVPSKLDVHARNIEVAWRKFQRQWNNYEVATRLDTESPKYRTSVLLACIDDEAFDIFDERTVWPWPKLAAGVGQVHFEDLMQGCCHNSGCLRCGEYARATARQTSD